MAQDENHKEQDIKSNKDLKLLKRQIKIYLLSHSSPRFQAFIIILFLSINTFFAAGFLLWLGVSSMPLRYFIVSTYGYILFFISIHWLIKYHLYRERFNEDLVEEVESFISEEDNMLHNIDFTETTGAVESSVSGDFGGIWDSISFDFDIGDLAALLIPLIILAGSLFFSVYFVYMAPALFAEIILDAIVMTYVFKKIKVIQRGHWAENLRKKTFWVYVIIVALLCLSGYIIQEIDPEIITMGDLFRD